MGGSHSHPVELLDQICLDIDSPKDLLSISLTCKQLSRIIIPDHIEFRVIRCDFQRDALWKALLVQPSQAAKILALDVISEQRPSQYHHGPVIVPRSLVSEDGDETLPKVKVDQESFALLADVIRRMPRLRQFHWLDHSTRPVNELFSALHETCGDLDDVEILNYSYDETISSVDLGNSPLWQLANLTHFSFMEYHISTEADIYVKYTDAMVDMLIKHCPCLEDLQIFQNQQYHGGLPGEHIGRLFEEGLWPNLRRLSIEGIALYESHQPFFAAHPKLEKLCIRDGYDCHLVFSNLPNLRSLDIDWELKSEEIPADVAAHLQYLAIDVPDEYSLISDGHLDLHDVLTTALNLRYLVLHTAVYSIDYLIGIFKCVPNLERLALQWASHNAYFESAQEDPSAFCEALALLPKLTHLTYVDSYLWPKKEGEGADAEDDEETDDFERSLKALSSAVGKLTFVEFGSNELGIGERYWLVIERGEDGAYKDYSDIVDHDQCDHRDDVDVDLWGGCFLGAAKGLLDKTDW